MRRLDQCSLAIIHLFTCKDCKAVLAKHFAQESTSKAGATKTPKKAKASRENGKLGGRPKKLHTEETRAKMREAWDKRKKKAAEKAVEKVTKPEAFSTPSEAELEKLGF